MKDPIDVFIRARPTANFSHENIVIDHEKGEITVKKSKKKEDGLINHQQDTWTFRFSRIFLNEPQDSFYEAVASKLVRNSVNGISGNLLAYGQTGAGKTFTISGTHDNPKYRGILPRSISSFFREIEMKPDYVFNVRLTYIEIYNEILNDLLSEQGTGTVVLQEDAHLGIFPQGASMFTVRSEEEALFYMFRGEANKSLNEHKLNKTSSRSHTVFTLYIESRPVLQSNEKFNFSKLCIFDLAGSERSKKTDAAGPQIIEASFINKSLSSLEQLIVAYNEKNKDFLPYRQSKLTYMLKDAIGGNGKTVFIANIWPEAAYVEETLSALRFASRTAQISTYIQENIRYDSEALIKLYENQIKDLKSELAMHNVFSERKKINYEPFSQAEQKEQQMLVEAYLLGKTNDIEITSLRQVKELFVQFRNTYTKLLKDSPKDVAFKSQQKEEGLKVSQVAENKAASEANKKRVGKEESHFGFGLGKVEETLYKHQEREGKEAPFPANTNQPPEIHANFAKIKYLSSEEFENLMDMTMSENGKVDNEALFAFYKSNQGKEIADEVHAIAQRIRDDEIKLSLAKATCNEAKHKIDELKKIMATSFPNQQDDETFDERLNIKQQIKVWKDKYLESMSTYKNLKEYIPSLENGLYLKKKLLFDSFMTFSQRFIARNSEKENSKHRGSEAKRDEKSLHESTFEKARRNFENIDKVKKFENNLHKF